jgi:stress-induced-phosphoprotein 1
MMFNPADPALAVYFETGDYDKCIETCQQAVDEGRSMRADFKLIAKALGRIGSAYAKKGDPTSAIKFMEKSLTEHRTPDVLNRLRQLEKDKAEADRKSYIDPEISAQEREKGNNLFKVYQFSDTFLLIVLIYPEAGDFAGAVKSYTEAIKRDPSDPRGYNNRATAYTKLVALPEALKDAETAIGLDSKFGEPL